jgi:hypothetical protein
VVAALGGLAVSVLAAGPTGSGPAEGGGFLWVIRIRSSHFPGGEVKPSVHVVDLRQVKEPYRSRVRCFVGKISRIMFLARDSPATRPDCADCWIRMIRMSVLRRQTSHLLLISTNLGCGTVLTAACARQGWSATGYYYYYYVVGPVTSFFQHAS